MHTRDAVDATSHGNADECVKRLLFGADDDARDNGHTQSLQRQHDARLGPFAEAMQMRLLALLYEAERSGRTPPASAHLEMIMHETDSVRHPTLPHLATGRVIRCSDPLRNEEFLSSVYTPLHPHAVRKTTDRIMDIHATDSRLYAGVQFDLGICRDDYSWREHKKLCLPTESPTGSPTGSPTESPTGSPTGSPERRSPTAETGTTPGRKWSDVNHVMVVGPRGMCIQRVEFSAPCWLEIVDKSRAIAERARELAPFVADATLRDGCLHVSVNVSDGVQTLTRALAPLTGLPSSGMSNEPREPHDERDDSSGTELDCCEHNVDALMRDARKYPGALLASTMLVLVTPDPTHIRELNRQRARLALPPVHAVPPRNERDIVAAATDTTAAAMHSPQPTNSLGVDREA